MNINQVLHSYNMSVLKAMAEINGIVVNSRRKGPHVKALATALYNREAVASALSRLSPRERRALDLLILFGGSATSQRLKQALKREGLTQERAESENQYGYYRPVAGSPRRPDSPHFEDIVARLTCLSLIVSEGNSDPRSTVIGFAPGIRLVIPPQVMPHLPEVTFEDDTPVPIIDIKVEASARTFQRDLYLYWSHVRDSEMRLTQQGYVFKRELKKLNETLLVPGNMGRGMGEKENPRLRFVRLLLQEMDLLKVRRGGTTINAIPVSDFWSDSPLARVQKTFQVWRDKVFWNELSHLQGITVQSWYTPDLSLIVVARNKVIEHLTKLPTREWVALERLVNRLRMIDYEFLFSREVPDQHRYYGYGYYSPDYDTPYSAYRNPLGWQFSPVKDEAEGWEIVETQFIRNIITGPLHWLGVVDIGYAGQVEEDGAALQPFDYQVTEIGARLLGLGDAPDLPTTKGQVVVQPNFQIFALDPISDHVLATLDQFAERVSAERAIEYKLTRQSVYAGQQRGWTTKRIVEYLEGVSDVPLPQNVARTLEEWEALHRRIVIHRRSALAQTATPEMMDALLANPVLAAHLGRHLLPTVALLKANRDAVTRLEHQLQKEGLPPARTSRPNEAHRPCLTLADDRRLIFAHKVPSIFLFTTLGHFIELGTDGNWRLTPASVQQALSRGLTIDAILKELTDLHRGPLPAWAVKAVKAWGKYYGDAHLETLTLIQIPDVATLRELLDDPELSPYLRPFIPDRGLARVDVAHLDEVRRLLAERGMGIVGTLSW
ncbi:MAG: helicase-associated domain-containing protein [Anaerolineae bacterium]|nr:MAG: helicase-associated domain-containing protein [Anaerolineae bacterium]